LNGENGRENGENAGKGGNEVRTHPLNSKQYPSVPKLIVAFTPLTPTVAFASAMLLMTGAEMDETRSRANATSKRNVPKWWNPSMVFERLGGTGSVWVVGKDGRKMKGGCGTGKLANSQRRKLAGSEKAHCLCSC
jgi:hypothetical protein